MTGTSTTTDTAPRLALYDRGHGAKRRRKRAWTLHEVYFSVATVRACSLGHLDFLVLPVPTPDKPKRGPKA
jgi:hypothetical protein